MEFFRKYDDSRIVCTLCQHYCKLKDGQIGICGVNMNRDGVLKNLVYGHIKAMNLDPIEKKPLYHFLPSSKSLSLGTQGCNFKCPFCQNWEISQDRDIKYLDTKGVISPESVVETALRYKAESISYTYNEPTIFWPYAKDIAKLAKKSGLKNIFVTNGFETSETIEDMVGFIDAVNVDLKSFNRDRYKKELYGSLDGVLETLKHFKRVNIWTEVTTLIIPNLNDSVSELKSIASFIYKELSPSTPWHISAFHPDYKMMDRERTSIKLLERAYKIGKEAGLKYIYMGNVPSLAITECECGEKLIVRNGFEVLENRLNNGKCRKCGKVLEGVFK